ncbi:hypothetical protein HY612_02590 [Candidatus Roizmanbacteria bacterium]|nr:hypothetical protein [Candidatus Roizmanbacteria bacterium]
MVSKLKRHYLAILLLLTLTTIVHHNWFFNFSPIVWGDSYLDFAEKIKEFIALPQIWYNNVAFGSLNIGISFWPFLFLAGILNQLGIHPVISQRLLALWPIAIFTPIFMYLLSYYILRSRIGALLSAIVYLFNVPFIIGRSGILTLSIATAIAPIVILFYIVTLRKKGVIYIIITSLLSYIVSFYEFRIFYMVVWILALYTLYHFFIIEVSRSLKVLIKIGIIFSSIIILVLLLNTYFIVGLNSVRSLTSNTAFDRPLIGQKNVNLINSLILFFNLWTGQSFDKPAPNHFSYKFFFIPIAAFLGLYFLKRNKYVPFFAILSLLGIFLTKQEATPFKDVYKWLFTNLPGFNAFRESTKFYFYIAFGYSILLGAFATGIAKYIKIRALGMQALLIITFIAFIFLWNAKPILTGELGYMFKPRQIPEEYITLKDYIWKQDEFFRILWVPHPSHWGVYSDLHPKISSWDIVAYDWQKFFASNTLSVFTQTDSYLFDVSSIKYLIVPIDDPANTDDFFNYMGKREMYLNAVKNLKFLKKIDAGFKKLDLFENPKYRPHIYITLKKETVNEYIPYQKISFNFISPTKYTIFLSQSKTPFYLNFSENFHPDWKIRVGQFAWFKVPTEENYFLSDIDHFKNDAGLNSFYLDPQKICQIYKCKKNKDGSYDINMTLFFRPQSYVYFGLIISVSILLGLALYFVFLSLYKSALL